MSGYFEKVLSSFCAIEESKWYCHEDYVVKLLPLKMGEVISAKEQFNAFIHRLKKGGEGDKREKTWQANPSAAGFNGPAKADIEREEENPTGVIMTVRKAHGSGGRIRWFRFKATGKSSHLTLDEQLQIMAFISGMHKSISTTDYGRTRQELWKDWYHKRGNWREYQREHLVYIAIHFSHIFGVPKSFDVPSQLDQNILNKVAAEVRDLVVKSGMIALRRRRIDIEDNDGADEDLSDEDEKKAPSKKTRHESSGYTSPDLKKCGSISGLPDYFLLKSLREQLRNGCDGIKEIAAVEYALLHLKKVHDLQSQPKSALTGVEIRLLELTRKKYGDIINVELVAREFHPFRKETIAELQNLSVNNRAVALVNIRKLKKELVDKMPCGLFCPSTEKVCLLDWVDDGLRYSKGAGMPLRLITATPSAPRVLTSQTAQCLRHIVMAFNTSMGAVISLMNCFHVLFFGFSMKLSDFPSTRTIRRHLYRLHDIDQQLVIERSTQSITTNTSPNGFFRLMYTVGDDTKQRKGDTRHVLLMTYDKSGNKDEFDPAFEVLTVSEAASKGSAGNSDLNVEMLTKKLPLSHLAHYGGNCSDNANDAVAEGKETFSQIIKILKTNAETAGLEQVYGVERKFIGLGDPFHIDNLLMTHASNKAFGKTNRDPKTRHRSFHHRSCMQYVYDITKDDPVLAQHAADEVLKNSRFQYKIQAVKERQQRWMVNAKWAARIVQGLEIDVDGYNFWVKWAQFIWERSSGWRSEACGMVVLMMLMPEITLGFYFEKDLGKYFEVTHQWHSEVGELCTRPGFRSLELHHLYFDWIAPYWEGAMNDPETDRFKGTFDHLQNKIINPSIRARKLEQVQAGIKGAHDELSKMSDNLLSAPLIFMVLSHPIRGPALIQATVEIMNDLGEETGNGWNGYQGERPSTVQYFYDLLNTDKEESVHYFKQLGLMSPCVRDELKKLSWEKPGSRLNESSTRLLDFKREYPVIFEALFAAFALMPSNSRLAEQVHGQMRESLKTNQPLKFTDTRQSYVANQLYTMREERRRAARKRQSPAAKTRVKHSDSKWKVQLEGEHLEQSLREYSTEALLSLPEDFQQQVSLSVYSDMGAFEMEKNMALKRMAAIEKKHSIRRRQVPTLQQWIESAKEKTPDNDLTWVPSEEQKILDAAADFLVKEYWKGIPWRAEGKPDGSLFFDEVNAVLPHLDHDSMRKMHTTKKASLDMVGDHIVAIKHLADNQEAPNILSDDDLKGMTKAAILSLFVKPDKSVYSGEKVTKAKKRRTALKCFIESCGTSLSNKNRYKLEEDSSSDTDSVNESGINFDSDSD